MSNNSALDRSISLKWYRILSDMLYMRSWSKIKGQDHSVV